MPISLDDREKKARAVLIQVADRTMPTLKPGLISYSELWEFLTSTKWKWRHNSKIVNLLNKIAAFEIAQKRPPLNELVVRKDKKVFEPEESWPDIKSYLKSAFGVTAPYCSHREAQEACWLYWGRKIGQPSTDNAVEEGVRQDRTAIFRSRNRLIVQKRKQLDKYECQACHFRLKIGKTWIIDCHHKHPIGLGDNVKITSLDDLVCLCPTCHRIAHTSIPPRDVDEIRAILSG